MSRTALHCLEMKLEMDCCMKLQKNTFLRRFALEFHFCQNNLGFIRWTTGTMPKPLGGRESMSINVLGRGKFLQSKFFKLPLVLIKSYLFSISKRKKTWVSKDFYLLFGSVHVLQSIMLIYRLRETALKQCWRDFLTSNLKKSH